jgi:hypothetical protein
MLGIIREGTRIRPFDTADGLEPGGPAQGKKADSGKAGYLSMLLRCLCGIATLS